MTEERKVIIRLENVTYKYKVYQDDGAPPTEEKGSAECQSGNI